MAVDPKKRNLSPSEIEEVAKAFANSFVTSDERIARLEGAVKSLAVTLVDNEKLLSELGQDHKDRCNVPMMRCRTCLAFEAWRSAGEREVY